MRSKSLVFMCLLLTGCASTLTKHWEGVWEVSLGDTYDEMVQKIGDVPDDYRCYESEKKTSCTAYYYYGRSFIYRFENSNTITSISR